MWVLDHLPDLDADFRVLYGVAGIERGEFGDLDAREFCQLAERAAAFPSVMQARAAAAAQDDDAGAAQGARVPLAGPPVADDRPELSEGEEIEMGIPMEVARG
jgi:hypothetical protein